MCEKCLQQLCWLLPPRLLYAMLLHTLVERTDEGGGKRGRGRARAKGKKVVDAYSAGRHRELPKTITDKVDFLLRLPKRARQRDAMRTRQDWSSHSLNPASEIIR